MRLTDRTLGVSDLHRLNPNGQTVWIFLNSARRNLATAGQKSYIKDAASMECETGFTGIQLLLHPCIHPMIVETTEHPRAYTK